MSLMEHPLVCVCGASSPPDFAFCPRCGATLQRSCRTCGLRSPPDFAFCPGCGNAFQEAATPDVAMASEAETADAGDRRTVTIVFADLAGFTSLSERLDPEEVRSFQNALFAALAEEIEALGGFVEKYVGDAVMAVFGAPVAHEDDPERALRAALGTRERLDALLDSGWRERLGQPVALHIGVHTGRVVAGRLGTGNHAAYAVTGDTVNTAARLQSEAVSGQVLVSAATHAVTDHAFVFAPHEPLRLKGKASLVEVFELRGLRAQRRTKRGLAKHGLHARMIGRDEELAHLLATFERAARGHAQLASITGDAGQGKTRLLDEFVRALAPARPTLRRVACSSLGEQTYGVFAGLIRDGFAIPPGVSGDDARDEFHRAVRAISPDVEQASLIASALERLLGLGVAAREDIDPAALGRQIFSAMRLLLEERMQAGPLVLIVEDLQWADSASLGLLRHLVERLNDRPLLVTLSYRPGFHPAALLASRAPHTGIRLNGLAAADIEGLLVELFGQDVLTWPAELHRLIVQRAGGNPLYLEEMVRGLIASGILKQTKNGWACLGNYANIAVPPTIQGLLAARLDQLPRQARRLLQEASVLGPVFDTGLLRTLNPAASGFDALLEALQDQEFIEEAPDAPGPGLRFRFSHALLHEAAYENLLLGERTVLHAAAAQALERSVQGPPARLEDLKALARHFELGAAPEKAAGYFLRAADWARGMYANEEAIAQYERAMDALQACQACVTEILSARERLGDVLALTGQWTAALAHYEGIRTALGVDGQPDDIARVLGKIGDLRWNAGEREAALDHFRSGLQQLAGQQASIERAHLYRRLGLCAFRVAEHEAAIEWSEKALSEAGRMLGADGSLGRQTAAALSHACNTIGIALARLGRLDEAIAQLERSVAVAEAHELLQAAGRAYCNLGVLYSAFDPEKGLETCRRGLEIARRIGDFGLQARLYASLAVTYCAFTDRCEAQAIDAARTSSRLDRVLDQRDHMAIPLIVLGQIHQCQGQPAQAMQHYREALALAEETQEPQLLFPCYDGLATVHLELGEDAEAERFLAQAQAVCQRSGLDPAGLVLLPFLA